MFQFVCLKSSHIKGNAGRSASYLNISGRKYSSG